MEPVSSEPSRARWKPAIYFALGQAGWFACVMSAARGFAYWGIVFVMAMIAVHVKMAKRPALEIKLIAAAVLIGAVWESAVLAAGLLAYPSSEPLHGFAPFWLLALWGLFAAQFNTTYRWMKNRLLAAAILGAIAGPVSFHAGEVLGALRFVKGVEAYVALAIGWAVILPVIVVLSRRWDGVQA